MPLASIERKLSVSTFWLAQGNFVLAVSEGNIWRCADQLL